jgi:hypothetical protein
MPAVAFVQIASALTLSLVFTLVALWRFVEYAKIAKIERIWGNGC